jgi:hypothetical protein
MRPYAAPLLTGMGFMLWAATPAAAEPITVGSPQWYEFGFTTVGVFARGSTPADRAGIGTGPSPSGDSQPAGAPPWTFTAPGFGALLTVTDAYAPGDRFAVYDHGVAIGQTSVPGISDGFGSADPAVAAKDPATSSGVFPLAPGPHSITIMPTASPYKLGAAYFRVDAVNAVSTPEPGSAVLLALGVLGMAGYPWWRRKCTPKAD